MKLRLTIIILIIVLTVGSIIITTGFISNSKYVDIRKSLINMRIY